MRLCLGSSSKWRQRIVKDIVTSEARDGSLSIELLTCSPDIDEKAIRRDTAEELTLAIAAAKLEAVVQKLSGGSLSTVASSQPSVDVIITSDQVAVWNGTEIREKPTDPDENRRFLRDYRNNSIETVAGFVVINLQTGVRVAATHRCRTHFGPIPDDVIDRVIARGDSLTCCGGFVVEDADLSRYVTRIDHGTVTSVQGVHVPLLTDLLRQVGVPLRAAERDH